MSEINKILLARVEDHCAFCGESETKVKKLFIGYAGKGICDSCVGFVREKMGLVKINPKLDKVLDNA